VTKSSINYLFPPDQILNLPTWRFVLHFMAPPEYHEGMLHKAIAALKAADTLSLDESGKAVGVPIEVPEDRRGRPNSLADYESDVWKIMGNMIECGFGDLYYEAVDWQE
jgi:hypothetical protein